VTWLALLLLAGLLGIVALVSGIGWWLLSRAHKLHFLHLADTIDHGWPWRLCGLINMGAVVFGVIALASAALKFGME